MNRARPAPGLYRVAVAAVSSSTSESAVSVSYTLRQAAVSDTSVGGREYCNRLAAATDVWIAALAALACDRYPRAPRFALVAVGGYGRGELSPQSDIDLLLVHQSKSSRLEDVASAIWYPIWDAGLKLGHAVRTLEEHLALAKTDLDTATALLTARPIAGDERLGQAIVESGTTNWTKRKKRWLGELQRARPSSPVGRRRRRVHARTRSERRPRRDS